MSIAQLKEFFSYESEEAEHIDEILLLLNTHRDSVTKQMEELQQSYRHLLRKLHYYGEIKKSLVLGNPLPKWEDYKHKTFSE